MDLSAFSYGEIMFYGGIILMGVSIIAIIAGIIGFSVKTRMIKKQLTDKYGF